MYKGDHSGRRQGLATRSLHDGAPQAASARRGPRHPRRRCPSAAELRVHDLTFAVGYLAPLVKAVFGDGSGHGVSIEYEKTILEHEELKDQLFLERETAEV
jgi:hypothetical protein